jgi:hypothetical protein
VSASLHLYAETVIAPQVLSVGDRLASAVRLDGGGVSVTVFGQRPELVRLRDAVDRLIVELDSATGTASGSAA